MDTAEEFLQVSGSILVCVDKRDWKDIVGRIYYPGEEAPAAFNDIARLLLEIDQIMDDLQYPEPSIMFRSFQKHAGGQINRKERDAVKKKQNAQKKGDKGTFVVQVQYRQHATWQGKVLWAEKNEVKQFRSALELLKLIDSALEENFMPDEELNV